MSNYENFMNKEKMHCIFHNGSIQAWESKEDKGWMSFYNCFLEKNRVGQFLFSLDIDETKTLIKFLEKWLEGMKNGH